MDEETILRLPLLKTAINKDEEKAREVIRLPDGNVYRHEINGVMIKLFSRYSDSFNKGVDDCLNRRKICPYSSIAQYSDWIDWNSGFDSCELALKLHGKKVVVASL